MVDGVNNNNKVWTKIDTTIKDKEYINQLDKKIMSILNGKQSINIEDLKKNSLFANMSDSAKQRFEDIANIDGNKNNFTAEELKVLYSLSDATLINNSFQFDGKYSTDKNSGLEQATQKEVQLIKENFVSEDIRKRYSTVDKNKFNNNKKTFEQKLTSSNVDEVMSTIQDKISSGYTDKRTGKPISITQAVVSFEKFVNDKSFDNNYEDFYQDVAKDFESQTGIPVSNFERLRTFGDGDSFTIGDWQYTQGEITNQKTGETIKGKRATWYNSASNTVPAVDGSIYFIQEYQDKNKGTSITFNYENPENAAPTSASVNENGKQQAIKYNEKSTIDPSLYNFEEK